MQSLQEAKEGGMEKSGRRASNSLLYEGFSQAGKEQQKVEDGLEQLGDRLQAVEDKLRNENNPALANLADHLQRMQEQMGSSGSADLKEMNEEAARSIGNLPQAEEDLRLQNLTQMFEAAAYSEDPNNARSLSAGAVQEATDLIQQFFWQQAMENHLINNQQSTRAPSRYRRQVEEYFRRIAEGSNGEIGIDWSFSPLWILGFVSLFAVLLFWHGKSLLQALTSSTAWKLIFLRIGVMLFLLLLLVKPYLITQETDPAQVRVVSLLDLSASMNTQDQAGGSHAWTWSSLT